MPDAVPAGGGDADETGMSVAAQFPIRAVARMTGLSVDTLRAWERRYQAVVPERGDRGRVYTERQIDRLRHLAALVANGHSIGSIAELPDAALRTLRSSGEPRSRPQCCCGN